MLAYYLMMGAGGGEVPLDDSTFVPSAASWSPPYTLAAGDSGGSMQPVTIDVPGGPYTPTYTLFSANTTTEVLMTFDGPQSPTYTITNRV